MDSTPKRALIATITIAAAVTIVFGTRDVITEVFLFFASFSVIWFVLFMLLRSKAVKAWPPGKRHAVIWLVAAVVGALLGLVPKLLPPFTH
jgi:small-conductance mechanosensitive channel